jgi:hypothetical protein
MPNYNIPHEITYALKRRHDQIRDSLRKGDNLPLVPLPLDIPPAPLILQGKPRFGGVFSLPDRYRNQEYVSANICFPYGRSPQASGDRARPFRPQVKARGEVYAMIGSRA